jgi:hypothetical protein
MDATNHVNIFNINPDLGRKITQSLIRWVDTESNHRSDPESIQKIRQRLAKCAPDHNTPSQTPSVLGTLSLRVRRVMFIYRASLKSFYLKSAPAKLALLNSEVLGAKPRFINWFSWGVTASLAAVWVLLRTA